MSACLTNGLLVTECPERIEVVSDAIGGLWSLDDNAARVAALPIWIPGEGGKACSEVATSREVGDGI